MSIISGTDIPVFSKSSPTFFGRKLRQLYTSRSSFSSNKFFKLSSPVFISPCNSSSFKNSSTSEMIPAPCLIRLLHPSLKASNGHVRDLPKSQMGIDIENDFEPKYITIRGKGDILAKLRKEAKKADKVYLATDPDRES